MITIILFQICLFILTRIFLETLCAEIITAEGQKDDLEDCVKLTDHCGNANGAHVSCLYYSKVSIDYLMLM